MGVSSGPPVFLQGFVQGVVQELPNFSAGISRGAQNVGVSLPMPIIFTSKRPSPSIPSGGIPHSGFQPTPPVFTVNDDDDPSDFRSDNPFTRRRTRQNNPQRGFNFANYGRNQPEAGVGGMGPRAVPIPRVFNPQDGHRLVGDIGRPVAKEEGPKILMPDDESAEFLVKQHHYTMMLNMKFIGELESDPNEHLDNFNLACSTINQTGVTPERIKLTLFPYTLSGKARDWFNSQANYFFQSWRHLSTEFVNKFYPPARTEKYMKLILNFRQEEYESFSKAWDRYQRLHQTCPHHGLDQATCLTIFTSGLSVEDRRMLDTAAQGNWNSLTLNDAYELIMNLAISDHEISLTHGREK